MTMDLSLSLRLGSAAAGGGASVALDNASILDKSATLTKVGTLTGVNGTPVLSNDAGGRFFVQAVGGNYEVRCGLVLTDYGAATSHGIEVTDANGAHSLTITVTAVTTATLGGGGSIRLGRQNGAAYQNKLTGPILRNLFGTNNAGGVLGCFAFRVRIRQGQLVNSPGAQTLATTPCIMGNGTASVTRGMHWRYYGPHASSAGYRGRIVLQGTGRTSQTRFGERDTSGNVVADNTGTPALRTAVIPENWTGLVVVVYLTTGASFGAATSVTGPTFVIYTIDPDGTATVGDIHTAQDGTWQGTDTTTNGLSVGTYTGSPSADVNDYSPFPLSDIAQIRGVTGALADWQEIAKGRGYDTFFAAAGSASGGTNRIARWWPLTSDTDLGLKAGCLDTADGTNGDGAFVASGTVTASSQLAPTYNGTIGLSLRTQGDGYVYGLPVRLGVAQTTSRTIQATCDIVGAATHVQGRLLRKADGAVIRDWTRMTASSATGAGVALSMTDVPIGKHYWLEIRREDDNAVVASSRDRLGVGFKVPGVGQSQGNLWLFGAGSAGVSAPSNDNVSFGLLRQLCNAPPSSPAYASRTMDIGVCEVAGDVSQSFLATAERLSTLAPSIPFMVLNGFISGESLATFYADQVWDSSGSYKAFGDYSTAGSGLLTDMLLQGGKDISYVLHDHGGSDVGRVYGDLMSALYGGLQNANTQVSNTPSGGGANVNPTTTVRNFAAAGLDYSPIQVVTVATPRGVYPTTGASASYASLLSFNDGYHTCRLAAAAYTGYSTTVEAMLGGYLYDPMFESATETAHQLLTDMRGGPKVGARLAMFILRGCGVLAYDPTSAFSSASRSGSVITVTATLGNGGSLFTPGTGAPTGFEVSEDGGSTWSSLRNGSIAFTTAVATGTTITLTRTSGSWAANTRIRFAHVPVNYFTANQDSATPATATAARATGYANENTDLDNLPYESFAAASPASGTGRVQGVPLAPTSTHLLAA